MKKIGYEKWTFLGGINEEFIEPPVFYILELYWLSKHLNPPIEEWLYRLDFRPRWVLNRLKALRRS